MKSLQLNMHLFVQAFLRGILLSVVHLLHTVPMHAALTFGEAVAPIPLRLFSVLHAMSLGVSSYFHLAICLPYAI